ncbi:hypothetical protein [Pseudomonas veronii]
MDIVQFIHFDLREGKSQPFPRINASRMSQTDRKRTYFPVEATHPLLLTSTGCLIHRCRVKKIAADAGLIYAAVTIFID